MPLSEFLRMARVKLESGQQKPCPSDLSSRPDNELVELVWENGQIMMHGQSSRITRSPTLNNLPSNAPKVRDTTNSRIGKFGAVESILNDMSPVVPSGDLDLSQDDEMVPWLSFPIDDALPQDYGSEILPEISGITGNGMSTQNSFVSVDKRNSCDRTVSNFHGGGNSSKAPSSSKARMSCSWPTLHCQTSDALGSGVSDIISNNRINRVDGILGNPAQRRDIVNDSTNRKVERQNTVPPANNSSLLNFSHFSRPASLVKANFQIFDGIPTSVSSGVGMVEVKEKGSAAASGSNPVKSMLVERFNSTQKDIGSSAKLAMVNSRRPVVKSPKEPSPSERTENLAPQASITNDKPPIPSNTVNSTKRVPDGERSIEHMAASSSVGSGNSADRVSCEQTHNSKRKYHEIEESECRSDEIETESVGAKKPTPARAGTGSKRSRAAEVHNLSERRRRDRINEKMRALQELIPNCNKADKASMLDEAIEYLKTLQLQVQIMSMGAGLCMPRMVFPSGMQHMHPAHVPHFLPMGVGMGYGMGMLDMNGGPPGCPIYPVPPLQVPHFPSLMPGPINFRGIPGPNLPVYGHPGQGLPNSVPRAPLVPLTGQPPVTSAMGLSAPRNGSRNEVHSTTPVLNLGNPVSNTNSESMCNTEAGSSTNHKSNQLQATDEVLHQSTAVQENKQGTDGRGTAAALTSTRETDINKEPGYD